VPQGVCVDQGFDGTGHFFVMRDARACML